MKLDARWRLPGAMILGLAIAILFGIIVRPSRSEQPTSPNSPSTKNTASTFDRSAHSIEAPDSIWVVVNKNRQLSPQNYKPADLVFPHVPLRAPGNESMQIRKDAARALEQMFAAAKDNKLKLKLGSGFRSYKYQVGVYNQFVATKGRQAADRESARPGYSEHQTGLAVDIEPKDEQCELQACFSETPEGRWLAAHAPEFGFVLRYDKNTSQTTGYRYEPWHFRYVGTSLAKELQKTGQTMEEFFDLPPASNYN